MVQVDLITGFLGAGKTTFLRRYVRYLVEQGHNVCILENDFGAVNVDAMLVQDLLGDHCEIETISGVIDQNTGTVSLRAAFPNEEQLLNSGGSGNVIIPVTYDNCVVIPQAATFEIQDRVFVFKVVDGKTQSAPVEVTRVNGGQEYIVNAGLNSGDVIVAEGVGLLREGTPIEVKQN